MIEIQGYINQFEGVKNEWLGQLITFMRDETELQECFDCRMPTYKGHDFYIAFAAQKGYFSFYTDETRVLELFKAEMTSTSLGKSCARIKYNEPNAINVTMNIIKEIISVNVFCGSCGVTVLEEGFTIHDDGPYGIILRGKCKKCNGQVARYVEGN